MKKSLLFATALLMPVLAFSSPENTKNYSGRVGRMILDAMKSAGVKKQNCTDNNCKYSMTNFSSSETGDGCGGGTTGYDAELTYSDGTTYTYHYCEGAEYDQGQKPSKVEKNKAAKLETIFAELDYFRSEGWTSYTVIEKIECSTYKTNPRAAYCKVTTPVEKQQK